MRFLKHNRVSIQLIYRRSMKLIKTLKTVLENRKLAKSKQERQHIKTKINTIQINLTRK